LLCDGASLHTGCDCSGLYGAQSSRRDTDGYLADGHANERTRTHVHANRYVHADQRTHGRGSPDGDAYCCGHRDSIIAWR